MLVPRLRSALVLLAATLGLGACYYDDGYGYAYPGYGYYGPGYYGPWYGWYGNYYYPGIGYYIYDYGGHRYYWNEHYRGYWEGRRQHWHGRNWNDRRWENWSGYHAGPGYHGAPGYRGNGPVTDPGNGPGH